MRAVIDPTNFPDSCDVISVELHDTIAPYSIIYSASGNLDTKGYIDLTFPPQLFNKKLYVVVKHRNSLETWSKSPVVFNSTIIYYDFTTDLTKAYGNNLAHLPDENYGIFSGDVNQDGIVNSNDYIDIENTTKLFVIGYVNEDLMGDWMIESSDFSLIENNRGKISLHP